jgi:alanine or glycine:cation symporter, AGCS family
MPPANSGIAFRAFLHAFSILLIAIAAESQSWAQVASPPIAPPIQGPTDEEVDQLLGALLKLKLADLPPGEHGATNPQVMTISNFIMAQRDIAAFQKANENRLPTEIEANELLGYYRDGWNTPIRYSMYFGKYSLTSDGPDTKAGTWDDISTAKNGVWFDMVDGFFGQYIVAPCEMIIFYDLYPWIEGILPKGQVEPARKPSLPIVVICLLAVAIFMTIRMAFINIRGFWHAIRVTMGAYDDPDHPGEVSHFQALSSALSATVGLGNIAGVAIAVCQGGPGAVFWLIVAGFFGMTSKFAECTLGQLFRKVSPDGVVSGGAMHYLRDGLAMYGLKPLGTFLATFFAIMCIGASFGGGCSFQVGQSLNAIREAPALGFIDRYPIIYGIGMAVMTGIVIIGGIKSIGKVADKIVPVMCASYVAMSLFIIIKNYDEIIPSFQLIFSEAFSLKAGWGGFLGIMVIGVRRASFSNEAGVGSAAIAHSAAKTEEPVSEGIVALLEPFIDTIVVCTMSALVIVITGAYSGSSFKEFVKENQKSAFMKAGDSETEAETKAEAEASKVSKEVADLGAAGKGAAVMSRAVKRGGYPWFQYILYGTVFLFAYSTVISWSYYGERCWAHLFGEGKSIYYKLIFLACVVLGSIITEGKILEFSDLMIFGMAFPNMIGCVILSGYIKQELDKYWSKYKSGKLALHAKK